MDHEHPLKFTFKGCKIIIYAFNLFFALFEGRPGFKPVGRPHQEIKNKMREYLL